MDDAEAGPGSRARWIPRMAVCLIAGWMIAGWGENSVSRAQTPRFERPRFSVQAVEPGAKVRVAVELVERGRPGEALPLLVDAVAAAPAFISEKHGAASYWLGRAYRAAGDSAQAHAAWRAGVNALTVAGTLDVRLADAYLRSVFERQKTRERQAASEVYLKLIARAGSGLRPGEKAIVGRHVAQTLPVLPDEKHTRITPDPRAFRRGKGRLTGDAGSWLATWWRRQDARPATVRNERLVEHLRRVVVAERRYGTNRRRAGVDARGRIYVRLGTPSVVERLDNDPLRWDNNSWPTENEFWVYEDLGPYAQFLFVRRGDRYVIGSFRDLLPNRVRGPAYTPDPFAGFYAKASSRTALSLKAGVAMKALRDYYRQVAPYQPQYLDLQSKIWYELVRNRPPGVQNVGFPVPIPIATAWARMNEVEQTERRLARRRRETVPRVRTETVETDDQLPVAARTARFLTEDGTTRTEVYWAVEPADLAPAPGDRLRFVQQGMEEPERYLLRVTGVRYGPEYASRRGDRADLPIDVGRTEPVVYSLAVPGATGGRYHLAVQWDQYAIAPDSSVAFVRRGTYHADSLQALPSDGARLALSDVVPLRADRLAEAEQVRDGQGFTVTPYPYDHVTPETNPALYVEAYHLAYGPDDRTRYTVEYEVEQRRKKGGVAGWFGATEETTTTQATTYEGTARTAREYIALDLSPYAEASRLHVTVRVIDEVSGQKASRTVEFSVERKRDD